MPRDQVCYEIIGLGRLYIKYSLVVKTFSLNHFSMVDADAEKYEVHYLAQSKLYRLVILNAFFIVNKEKNTA
jgi:hypothetical protein